MKKTTINLPTIGAIAATRTILGLGVGLLLAGAIPEQRRRGLGYVLLGVGVASTVPLVAIVFGGVRRERQLKATS